MKIVILTMCRKQNNSFSHFYPFKKPSKVDTIIFKHTQKSVSNMFQIKQFD